MRCVRGSRVEYDHYCDTPVAINHPHIVKDLPAFALATVPEDDLHFLKNDNRNLEKRLGHMGVGTAHTIYNMPVAASKHYAAVQEIYDKQVASQMVSRDGWLETVFSHHVRVFKVDLTVPHLDKLMETRIRTSIAAFPAFKAWAEQRNFSSLGTPALGSIEDREALKKAIYHLMSEAVNKDVTIDRQSLEKEAQSLINALNVTIEDELMRQKVKAGMASLCAA